MEARRGIETDRLNRGEDWGTRDRETGRLRRSEDRKARDRETD